MIFINIFRVRITPPQPLFPNFIFDFSLLLLLLLLLLLIILCIPVKEVVVVILQP